MVRSIWVCDRLQGGTNTITGAPQQICCGDCFVYSFCHFCRCLLATFYLCCSSFMSLLSHKKQALWSPHRAFDRGDFVEGLAKEDGRSSVKLTKMIAFCDKDSYRNPCTQRFVPGWIPIGIPAGTRGGSIFLAAETGLQTGRRFCFPAGNRFCKHSVWISKR